MIRPIYPIELNEAQAARRAEQPQRALTGTLPQCPVCLVLLEGPLEWTEATLSELLAAHPVTCRSCSWQGVAVFVVET